MLQFCKNIFTNAILVELGFYGPNDIVDHDTVYLWLTSMSVKGKVALIAFGSRIAVVTLGRDGTHDEDRDITQRHGRKIIDTKVGE